MSGRKTIHCRGEDSSGFTLIELMVAMVFLAIGLFSIVQMEVLAIRGSGYARERSEAQLIAMGVIEEFRAQALQWTDLLGANDFGNVFSGDYQIQLTATPVAVPPLLDFQNLRSVLRYMGNQIAAGATFAQAYQINVFGKSPSVANNIEASGALYRVHYIAYPVITDFSTNIPDPNVVRMSVYVSWDNRDFGNQQINWSTAWQNATTYFQRNMVTVTFYLMRNKVNLM
jgi:prepilin-type N-terminal cleavage/methylation domain-containing protein